jgi:hypothetical protein
MSVLLEEKYKYIVFQPVDDIRSQLKSIVEIPWYDISVNLDGKVLEDNSFKLYSKQSIGINVFGVIQNISVIKGKLEGQGEQTTIHIEVKPNDLVLLVLYLIVFIFLFKLFGLFFSSSAEDWIMIGALFFSFGFIRSLIYFSMGRLKNRFERVMLIHPEE